MHAEIAPFFAAVKVELLLDPFERGVDVLIAMERLQIHGAVFHATPESVNSDSCATELDRAREIEAPIFVLCDSGTVPEDMRRRIYIDLGHLSPGTHRNEFERLAETVVSRARVHRLLQTLREPALPMDEQETAAHELFEEEDQALAEFVPQIGKLYRPDMDPTAIYWLAMAIGKAGHPEGRHALRKWLYEVKHSYPKGGIQEALERLGCGPDPASDFPHESLNGTGARRVRIVCFSIGGVIVTVVLAIWIWHPHLTIIITTEEFSQLNSVVPRLPNNY